MDTNAVADALGTTPRRLRQFLRSQESTFQAVGSGARYDFTQADLPALSSRFSRWNGGKGTTIKPAVMVHLERPTSRDQAVWDEEGPVALEDIRRPEVRARVRRVAREQEARLDALLLAAGLHISQMRVRQAS